MARRVAGGRARGVSGTVRGKGARNLVAQRTRTEPIRSSGKTVSTRRVARRGATTTTERMKAAQGRPKAPEPVLRDRLNRLLELLKPDLPDALSAANSTPQLEELAGRISSVLPGESATAKAVGPVYETSDLTSWLRISRQALNKKVHQGDVLAMKTSDGHTIYPAWQFAVDGSVRPGVAEAVKALMPVMDDWTRTLWFSGRSPELGDKSPADWLEGGGEPGVVVTAARRRARRLAQ